MKNPKKNIDVSVIILSYFHEKYLEKAIMSVLNQKTSYSFEIVIGDDSSQDLTMTIIDKFINDYPDIISKVTHESNVGTTRNLCDCLSVCQGEYITLLAGDDYFSDIEKNEIQVNWLKKNSDYIAVGNSVKGIYSNGGIFGIYPNKSIRGKDVSVSKFFRGNFYPVHGIMFRNIFTSQLSKFDKILQSSRLIEDLSLNVILLDNGKVHILDRIMYAYLGRFNDDKESSKNFNSTFTSLSIYIEHANLVKNLKSHYGKKYNFDKILALYFTNFLLENIKLKNQKKFSEILSYTSPSILFYSLVIIIPRRLILKIYRLLFLKNRKKSSE